MVGGGYAAGRFMRNSEIQGQPAALIAGVVGLVGYRRAGGAAGRMVLSGLIGAGCYGAGKMGEKHGEESGNDGNLFSWDSEGGMNLD